MFHCTKFHQVLNIKVSPWFMAYSTCPKTSWSCLANSKITKTK